MLVTKLVCQECKNGFRHFHLFEFCKCFTGKEKYSVCSATRTFCTFKVARRETLPAAATNFLPSQVSLSYRLVKLSLVRGDMRSDLMSSKLDFLKPWLKSLSARRLTLIIILTTTVMTRSIPVIHTSHLSISCSSFQFFFLSDSLTFKAQLMLTSQPRPIFYFPYWLTSCPACYSISPQYNSTASLKGFRLKARSKLGPQQTMVALLLLFSWLVSVGASACIWQECLMLALYMIHIQTALLHSYHLFLLSCYFKLVAMATDPELFFFFLLLPEHLPHVSLSLLKTQHYLIIIQHTDTYQGIMRPKRVDLLRLTRKPTVGSVIASQALPTNRMIEAQKGSSQKGRVEKSVLALRPKQ